MNTEEKAKAYDEALNWMREIYPGLHGATKEDAEHFFPELAESEDERIRKAIIELLKEVGRDDTGISENAKCMIAYLEKQKEQKPLTTEETELNSIAFLEQMGYTCIPPGKEQKPTESRKRNKPKESWLSEAKYEIEHADELLIQKQEELREIRELKNKEQKPVERSLEDDHIIGFVYDLLNEIEWKDNWAMSKEECLRLLSNYSPQKPAEKQDYSGLNDLERAILRGFLAAGMESVPVTIIKETAKECLAQMKPAEWSEEDEATIGTLINYFEGDALDCSTDEMIRRIRALRPSWKPSEEQKEALEYVIRDYREDGCNATANYLQEILDHLKNM